MRKRRKRHGEAWKIPVFQVIHRTEEDRFSPLALKSERLSHQISRRPLRKRRLESYVAGSIPADRRLYPGAFQTQIHYISRPVTKGQACSQAVPS